MSHYIAFRLRKLPVTHWHECPETNLVVGQNVVVKTQHGTEIAIVLKVTEKMPKAKMEDTPFIKSILRPLSNDDRIKLKDVEAKETEASSKTKIEIERHNLNMKLLRTEYLFDYSRVIFYFKSENKVDFRELLKSLASLFKTRIELKQIGVRDEAKLLGGIGCCGKVVCCSQFMTSFTPVSTKMAKEQNLTLNPTKLSGICGRLLCCLSHEYKYYASFHGKYPKVGSEIVVETETARVLDLNYITMKAIIGFKDRRKVPFSLEVVKGRRDKETGRNLWWIQMPGEEEPDLSPLLENLNPPGSSSKKKKNKSATKKNKTPVEQAPKSHNKPNKNDEKSISDKKISDSPQSGKES